VKRVRHKRKNRSSFKDSMRMQSSWLKDNNVRHRRKPLKQCWYAIRKPTIPCTVFCNKCKSTTTAVSLFCSIVRVVNHRNIRTPPMDYTMRPYNSHIFRVPTVSFCVLVCSRSYFFFFLLSGSILHRTSQLSSFCSVYISLVCGLAHFIIQIALIVDIFIEAPPWPKAGWLVPSRSTKPVVVLIFFPRVQFRFHILD
jgi:hypothetical protein